MIRKMVRTCREEIAHCSELDDRKSSPTPDRRWELGYLALCPGNIRRSNIGYLSYIIATEEIARIDGSQAARSRRNSLEFHPSITMETTSREKSGSLTLRRKNSRLLWLTNRTPAQMPSFKDDRCLEGSNGSLTDLNLHQTHLRVERCLRGAGCNRKREDVRANSPVSRSNGTPGFVTRRCRENVWRLRTGELYFNDCRVPERTPWQRETDFTRCWHSGRRKTEHRCHGLGDQAFELALKYAHEREQFERPIGVFR